MVGVIAMISQRGLLSIGMGLVELSERVRVVARGKDETQRTIDVADVEVGRFDTVLSYRPRPGEIALGIKLGEAVRPVVFAVFLSRSSRNASGIGPIPYACALFSAR
jgi:hypothetical protein